MMIIASSAEAGSAPSRAVAAALEGYVHLARGTYAAAVREAESLRTAVHRLLERPSAASLAEARAAWIASRDPYGRSEVYRFSGGPIDDRNPVTREMGPEGRINAWPVDEAFLDYVAGSRRGGLIGDRSVPMSEETLVQHNASTDETEVTLGYHAIEFLLWGQDLDRKGPGRRPYTDFMPGDPIRDRRRACLSLLVDVLVGDLTRVAHEWDPGPRGHADRFRTLDPLDALGQALSGPATLAAFELAAERIGVALSSGGQEDEQSCFSDNTHRDIVANLEGLALVLEGDGREPGLLSAIEPVDPIGAAVIRDQLERARRLAYTIEPPFDAVLMEPENDPRRRQLRALAGELIGLATAIQQSGKAVGAKVLIGGGG